MSGHLRERPGRAGLGCLFFPEVHDIRYQRWPSRTRLKFIHRRTVVEDASDECHLFTAFTSKHTV